MPSAQIDGFGADYFAPFGPSVGDLRIPLVRKVARVKENALN